MKTIKIKTTLQGRLEAFRTLALGYATGLPVLLEGKPGVGKTATVLQFLSALNDGDQMKAIENSYILEFNEGTKSQEIHGMLDIKALAIDKEVKYITPIATKQALLFNEIDKATGPLRNSLLSIMNEKFLMHGDRIIRCQHKLCVGTANFINDDEVEAAFWDRFIIKTKVKRMTASQLGTFLKTKDFSKTSNISIPEAEDFDAIVIPDSSIEKFISIVGNKISDRTYSKVPMLTKAVSVIYKSTISQALIKVCAMLTDIPTSTSLANKLQSPEYLEILNKVKNLESLSNFEDLESELIECKDLIKQRLTEASLNEQECSELGAMLTVTVENHPKVVEANEYDKADGDVKEDVDCEATL